VAHWERVTLLPPPVFLPPFIQVVHGPEPTDENTQSSSKLAVKGFQRAAGFVGPGQRFCLEEFGSDCGSKWLQGANETDGVHLDGGGPTAGRLDGLDQAAGSGLGQGVLGGSKLECQDHARRRINPQRHLGIVRARRLADGHGRVEGG